MDQRKAKQLARRRRLAEIVDIGVASDFPSRAYDLFGTLVLIINLIVSVSNTFDDISSRCGALLLGIEYATAVFFGIDYILRIYTARFLLHIPNEGRAIRKYILSFSGIIDLLSFLPYFMPFFFPAGAAVFRMFRVIRVFRLFQINAYYDSLNVIKEVLASKSQQLLSSVFIILVLMLASSLCMYSLEHEAQPEVFTNAFSGIWWAVSTLLTIGYGDIYPITPLGKIFSIVITFLGVGMVAIPTGIISAGFVDQYSRLKRMSEYASEDNVNFIKLQLGRNDTWVGKEIKDLGLPHGVIVAMIRRGGELIVPRGDVVLKNNDTVILGADALRDDTHIDLKEIVLRKAHPWNGQRIRDLDISRRTFIVMVRRRGTMLIPRGDLILLEDDCVLVYSQTNIAYDSKVQI